MDRKDIISIRAGTSRVFRFNDPKQVSVARSLIQRIKQNEEIPDNIEGYITTTDGSTRQIIITAVPKKDGARYEDIPAIQ